MVRLNAVVRMVLCPSPRGTAHVRDALVPQHRQVAHRLGDGRVVVGPHRRESARERRVTDRHGREPDAPQRGDPWILAMEVDQDRAPYLPLPPPAFLQPDLLVQRADQAQQQ
ncbi:hypothetical protein GCM10020256_12050 [Streptomyces thermocoprophilus]